MKLKKGKKNNVPDRSGVRDGVRRCLLPLPDRGSNPRKILEEITMRFYRVHLYSHGEGSDGYRFFTTKAEAMKAKGQFDAQSDDYRDDWESLDAEIDVLDITPNKRGILRALERYASHERNG